MSSEKKENYRLIKTGKNVRREYLALNRSPIFSTLPEIDTAQEQKKSYFNFLNVKLKKLLNFYFPVYYEDHNNNINIEVDDFFLTEPSMTQEEACYKFLTWSYKLFLKWRSSWVCNLMKINLDETKDIKKNLLNWVNKGFKINSFNLEEVSENVWKVKENDENLEITIEIKEKKEDSLLVSFHHKEDKEILLCRLPKMDDKGVFIINGHHKVAVCQSVRAPSIYCYFDLEQRKFLGEVIPYKGSWLNIVYNSLLKRIEIKFLNSKKVVGLRDVFNFFEVPSELVELLLMNSNDVEKKNDTSVKIDIPKFIFTEKNSYFDFGELGRKKFNNRIVLKNRIIGKTLSEDILDSKGDVIFEKNTLINNDNFKKIESFLRKGVNEIDLPNSTNSIYWIKVKSSFFSDKSISVIGIIDDLPKEKIYFDIADLFCVVSYYLNVFHGIISPDLDEDKDNLENQSIRCIGDIIGSMFDSKLGEFLYKDMSQKYLANISQLKKTDLSKMPNLRDFDNLLKVFFNTSPLVQLQNQNNAVSEISYARKISVLGSGGFSSSNITLTARNVHISHCGRYGLMSTQEGKNFGLSHNLTLSALINEYGQVMAPYHPVVKGVVFQKLVYLTSEEEREHYISHSNIKINEKNEILEKKVLVKHEKKIILVDVKMVDYIDSSFYHLTSVEESLNPFTPYNDATRTLMTSNMQRSVIAPIKNQEPLVSTGAEVTLRDNSSLTLKVEEDGFVTYVDSNRIEIKNSNNKIITYKLDKIISNKYILNFRIPSVKKGDNVKKGDIIADGYYSKNGELSLGYNLRIAYLSCSSNFEDAIAINQDLVKRDIYTYIAAKEYTISRYNTKFGPEIFTNLDTITGKKKYSNLDDDGIIKVGSVVNEGDILVRKITPKMSVQESEEEMLLFKVLGGKGQKYVESSLILPKGESSRGVVYEVLKENETQKKELELIKVRIAFERKLEDGDKMTARFGNKGVIKLIPSVDMPYDEHGPYDVVINCLGVSPRMNMGQLLEVVLAESAYKLNIKLLVRPFNTISIDDVKRIAEEAGIPNMGSKILWDGVSGEPFKKEIYTGRIYMTLLNHKSVDKLHARSTGAYSLIYQQPLKGRKRAGGQRCGEMEGWVNLAHGASKTLLRIHSSDDLQKRSDLQNYLLFGKRNFNLLYNKSESFNLVLQYLRGMGFNLEATNFQDKSIDFYKFFTSKT